MSWTLFDEELVLRRILNLGFRACWAKSSQMMHFLLTLSDVEFDFWFCLVSSLRWLFVNIVGWFLSLCCTCAFPDETSILWTDIKVGMAWWFEYLPGIDGKKQIGIKADRVKYVFPLPWTLEFFLFPSNLFLESLFLVLDTSQLCHFLPCPWFSLNSSVSLLSFSSNPKP